MITTAKATRRNRTTYLLMVAFSFALLLGIALAYPISSSATIALGAEQASVPDLDPLESSTPTSTPACSLAWRLVASPALGVQVHLISVAAVISDDVWAVGWQFDGNVRHTLTMHWNGTVWSEVTSPNVGTNNNYLYQIDAVSANDVWAVGSYIDSVNGESRTLVMRWNGTVWSVEDSPSVGASSILSGVSSVSTDDVWVVGSYFDHVGNHYGLTMHWDGATWSILPSLPAVIGLNGIAAVSADNVWVVGSYYYDDYYPIMGLAMHWDGIDWTSHWAGDYRELTSVVAVTSEDIWAVGWNELPCYGGCTQERGRNDPSEGSQIIMHWDGASWTDMPGPSYDWSRSVNVVTAVSTDDVWAVGSFGNETLTMHWDGSELSEVPSPGAHWNDRLWGVAAISATDVWAVGAFGDYSAPLIMRYSDECPLTTPTLVPTRTPTSTPTPSSTRTTTSTRTPTNTVSRTSTSTRTSTATPTALPPTGTYVPSTITPTLVPPSHIPTNTTTPTPTLVPPTATDTPTSIPVPPTATYTYTTTATNTAMPSATPIPVMQTPTVAILTATSTSEATVTTGATQTPIPMACVITFTDVPSSNTFYANIRCLACQGIISGYADGTFKPNNLVTRGQLAKIVSNAAGFSESPDPQIFADVSSSNTFYPWINRLARRGHMSGYACGGTGEPCTTGMPYFRPFANATRGQTSKIVANAAGYTEIPTEQTFEDVPSTNTFYREIQRLASRNIMQGYSCGGVGEPCLSGKPYFRHQNNVTRGQSAKIVANTFYPGCTTP